ncbi:hypothetical protein N7519_006054 [Penicillium mononematosum]|uniref:uncharacterized protein n=1 Tax=Penicillium mononematosum TaxID=268346 RepID=UPI0025478B18|nr:uncharacterized protein N7519_006054 [Penicillium mononematosum]KAJ6184753.1 hypothetical protein N7519_006054 [Penicillium mononematosum]
MRPPAQTVDHNHTLIRGKLSAEHHLSKGTAIKNSILPLLRSVPTDQQPLLRQDSAPSIYTQSQSQSPSPSPNLSFIDKYGRYRQMVHYGSNSTTRLHESKTKQASDSQLVAIKVYRRSILRGPPSSSHSTSLHPSHPNILPILDILHNERAELCLVMPYCAGGDLHTLLSRKGALPTQEADCIITQILRALASLHDHDTAHRDVRLETVLLTANGAVKLAGFGDGHIRRMWEESAKAGRGGILPRDHSHLHMAVIANSPTASFVGMRLPYIAPEEFDLHFQSRCHDEHDNHGDCDSRPADVWATAVVYMALVTDRILWRSARPNQEDARYLEYLHSRSGEDGYPPIEALGQRRRNAIYAMLHPCSWKRITTAKLLQSEWINSVVVCEAGAKGY